MSVWFEGNSQIECDIQKVKSSFENYGEHYVGVVSLMPGLTTVELVEQGDDFVTIKTNEGIMKRTHISKSLDDDRVVVEFDEEYQLGSKTTGRSHYLDEFTKSGAGVNHRTVISEVKMPGFLGFFYRNFGNSSIGKAVLKSYRTYFEK